MISLFYMEIVVVKMFMFRSRLLPSVRYDSNIFYDKDNWPFKACYIFPVGNERNITLMVLLDRST